ncbi:VPA1262 family N-terminal domain-containing protein [Brevundimonas sp.]|uniref:VPA1262 family N-terminal domain-containing protein n=1 Tax=Brevundimonas sp. TaxID=1871086 RepID=UPI003D6C9679
MNVLTIATFEEFETEGPSSCLEWIGRRFPVAGLKGWKFGLARYRRTVPELRAALERRETEGVWAASGYPLATGELTTQPAAFVPSDSYEPVPLNAVLKNNFFNGSYVLELADPEKEKLRPLLDAPTALAELGSVISERGGPALDGVSDRLGNILVQFPIECVALRWAKTDSGVEVTLDWSPTTTPRSVTVNCSVEADQTFTGFASATATIGPVMLPVGHCRHPHRLTVWDEGRGVLLAATSPGSFVSAIISRTSSMAGQRRLLIDGAEVSIAVDDHHSGTTVGTPSKDPNGSWEGRRLYRASRLEMEKSREFVAYGGADESREKGRDRALGDLRWLINRHGEEGVWLWDPYLAAADILETLCRNRHGSAPMRALTEGLQPPSNKCATPETTAQKAAAHETALEAWIHAQRQTLESGVVEPVRLNLEFRVSRGMRGWKFHDRFLIFPRAERAALVWSLGTSVNHAGQAHHILQKVPDGQRIEDDFLSLWDGLTDAEHRIWQCP